ncbi:hypothetical protein ABVK25_006686 [Lepraria finkii]|uniref:Uncharacterized protein n=1 Tax=Lepraria finkii TaxID=1340010 RepID=A0ABR4B5D0_9LECA
MQLKVPEEFNKQEIESLHSELDLAEEADLDAVSPALGRTRKQVFAWAHMNRTSRSPASQESGVTVRESSKARCSRNLNHQIFELHITQHSCTCLFNIDNSRATLYNLLVP